MSPSKKEKEKMAKSIVHFFPNAANMANPREPWVIFSIT